MKLLSLIKDHWLVKVYLYFLLTVYAPVEFTRVITRWAETGMIHYNGFTPDYMEYFWEVVLVWFGYVMASILFIKAVRK